MFGDETQRIRFRFPPVFHCRQDALATQREDVACCRRLGVFLYFPRFFRAEKHCSETREGA